MIFSTRGVFGVANYKSELKIQKFKIADPVRRTKMHKVTWLGWNFVTESFLGSMITNPRSKFINSKWRIQYRIEIIILMRRFCPREHQQQKHKINYEVVPSTTLHSHTHSQKQTNSRKYEFQYIPRTHARSLTHSLKPKSIRKYECQYISILHKGCTRMRKYTN